jgi:hypothetical protein
MTRRNLMRAATFGVALAGLAAAAGYFAVVRDDDDDDDDDDEGNETNERSEKSQTPASSSASPLPQNGSVR